MPIPSIHNPITINPTVLYIIKVNIITIVHSLHAYPPYTQSYHNQPYSPVHNQGKHNNYSS